MFILNCNTTSLCFVQLPLFFLALLPSPFLIFFSPCFSIPPKNSAFDWVNKKIIQLEPTCQAYPPFGFKLWLCKTNLSRITKTVRTIPSWHYCQKRVSGWGEISELQSNWSLVVVYLAQQMDRPFVEWAKPVWTAPQFATVNHMLSLFYNLLSFFIDASWTWL